jgi:hypothetical protein
VLLHESDAEVRHDGVAVALVRDDWQGHRVHRPVRRAKSGFTLAWFEAGGVIVGTRLDATGTQVGVSAPLVTPGEGRDVSSLSLTALPNDSLMVWVEGERIVGRLVDEQARAKGDVFVIGKGRYPQVLADGDSVIVVFVGGDVDRPMVIGAAYNGGNVPPFALPQEKSRSGIRTHSTVQSEGYNELSFEDLAGREQIRVRAQRDLDEHVLHDHTRAVDHDQTFTVGGDQRESIRGAQSLRVGAARTERRRLRSGV